MKKLILGVSSGVLYSILSMVVALLSTPYFLKFISKEEFGIFFLINNLIIWSGLLNLGLRGSFKLQLSTFLGSGENTTPLISTAFFSQCIIAFGILCLGSISSFFIPSLFKDLFNTVGNDLRIITILLLASFSISLISNPLVTIFSVYNKDSVTYSFKCLLLILQPFTSILLLSKGYGIVGLAISSLAAEIIFILFSFFQLRAKLPGIQIKLSEFDFKVFQKSITLGKWFLAGFLAQLFIRHTDLFLIETFAGIETITTFIITSKLYFIATTILMMVIKIISPQLTKRIHSEASSNDIVMIFLKSIIGYILTAGMVIYFSNEFFISRWVGRSFYLGNNTNFILLLIFYFGSFNYCIRAILMAQLKIKSQKISALIEGVLHISLAIALGYFFHLQGIILGIFISTLVSSFVNFNILLSGNLFQIHNKRELSMIALYVLLLSVLLYLFPSSNQIIDLCFICLFLGSYYLISQNEFHLVFKSLKAR